MKKIICLTLCLLILLPGCGIEDSVNFYYLRGEFQYDRADGVIVPEKRDITGHVGDLEFLLSLYLMGPQDTEYAPPFPHNTKLVSVTMSEEHLTITLSEIAKILSDSEFTLACACISLTAMELYPAETVSVVTGEREITLTRDALTLYDESTPSTTIGG